MRHPCACMFAVLCIGMAWGCSDPASRRAAVAASEALQRGLSVAGVVEVAERLAAKPSSWVVGIQECRDTSDVFAVSHSAANGPYVMIAISDSDSNARERWRKEFVSRDQLVAEIEKLPVTQCRSATISFGQEWVIAATLDDQGRLLEAKPPYQLD